MSRMRGAALVLVLWLIALLTAMIGAFALTARVEALQGSMLRNGAQAQEYARSGLEYALFRLQSADTQARWRADGRRYRWQMDDATVEIRITDESGKVDLNMAEPALLAGLVRAVGGEQGRDARIAGAIVDWRDGDSLSQPGGGAEDRDYADAGLPYGAKDGPFETLGELRLVLGMDGELYRKLLPNLTLYSGRSRPEARFAPGPVLTAMGLDARQLLAQRDAPPGLPGSEATVGGSDTYSIESRARLSQGREAVLRAVVSISASALPGSAYTVLRWEEGAAVQ
ncbi:general secretion pathway protein GspK [Xanthomonas hortorum]|uniref:Type II secretion system protein K n=1 Tax=Xanthomonas hortorum pv. gardneri TaxID=2754056 RepID=A0A6V7EJ27_9XANT|nr:type II secretion system protein GspK [Xanthomonas hortorum]MCC4623949.1 type II secretion system protein GspK [Xanthomonas campestris pv. nigromaculans]APP79437.1 general secretion pathway protein GspK [Xanthomonas hortorum pv. gardneri]EGD19564.1 General secretion pathway protein K [Xanthomonas hortorum ATCC 19865]KLB00027.1 general secretion pathway protein GspK [Xanthomonas hortorum pv. gardneri]KLB03536.1 general secretion pathway protein GspK [Xanthomonas hortorum pv. gardneri]